FPFSSRMKGRSCISGAIDIPANLLRLEIQAIEVAKAAGFKLLEMFLVLLSQARNSRRGGKRLLHGLNRARPVAGRKVGDRQFIEAGGIRRELNRTLGTRQGLSRIAQTRWFAGDQSQGVVVQLVRACPGSVSDFFHKE